jgi:hypothetical protein
MAITYRKTKDGQWVAFGPASEIQANTIVTVTKRDGTTKREMIASVGKPFTANGQQMVYGYISTDTTVAADGSSLIARRSNGQGSHTCDQCGHGRGTHRRNDSSGIAGLVCSSCNRDADYELSFA